VHNYPHTSVYSRTIVLDTSWVAPSIDG
jgi:hypothetical protein